MTCERLLRYKNVSLYLWEDNEMLEMMEDLNNYIDEAHYGPDMCDKLTKRIGALKKIIACFLCFCFASFAIKGENS